jgi:uncharacterized membrane protein YtjA (UPF0391 family)
MLFWSFIFLLLAIAAAVLAFGGIVVASSQIAKLLFLLFLVLFLVTLITGSFLERRTS